MACILRVTHIHRNQLPHLYKTPKAEIKDFTIIDRNSNTLHHQAKETLHIHIKDPSLYQHTSKVKITTVFNKLLKPYTQLVQPYTSTPHPNQPSSSLGLSTQKTTDTSQLLHLYLQLECPPCVHTFQTSRQLNL